MNDRERQIAERYREQGWKPLRNGAPDFLMLKVIDGDIKEMMAVEVKRKGARLTYEQGVWRKVCEKAGVPFKVEVVA